MAEGTINSGTFINFVIPSNTTKIISFSTYEGNALIFTGSNKPIMYLFCNGYLLPCFTDNDVTVTLNGSTYKDITIVNNKTAYLQVGVLRSPNLNMALS